MCPIKFEEEFWLGKKKKEEKKKKDHEFFSGSVFLFLLPVSLTSTFPSTFDHAVE